ncbi:aspartate/glutamate racemase family protein [Polymorphobacter sp.]|uniref:aspartate/glutamate racemase family protein n=1 Tax=Polymorphobacter sp. TaxID=1909290 RepID=UPI003F72C07C
MAQKRVLVIVPFPLDDEGVANREAQLQSVQTGPDIVFDFKPVKAAPLLYETYHDYLLADMSIFEVGISAQDDGYDAVCIDTMSDSGMNALRSVLDIPVISPARASYLTALMFAGNFSIMTQWGPWKGLYTKNLREYGLESKCVSIRSPNIAPNVSSLLGGKEEDVFPKFLAAAMQCVEDGAEAICLGSTTMHQSHAWLAERLPVPLINPGPLTYKLVEVALSLGLTQSRRSYPKPETCLSDMIHGMMDGGARALVWKP